MDVITTTPFGQRPITAGLLAAAQAGQKPAEVGHFDKWELFRELCVARGIYGVSDRDLTVLNALLSFHQGRALSDNDNLIVFPSNKALCERAHGMAESTLRRHLAALVGAGLLHRHDSPNGKRYCARDASGSVVRAFGFNLRPLLVQAIEIASAADNVRQTASEYRRQRETCSVLLRDVSKLTAYGIEEHPSNEWSEIAVDTADCARAIRRKLSIEALAVLEADLSRLLGKVQTLLKMPKTNKMDGNDVENERHYQNSNTEPYDFEPCLEKQKVAESDHDNKPVNLREPRIPIGLVTKTCPDILDYAKDGVNDWYDLVATANFVRGMMGISPDAWQQAQIAMGPENASIVLACILQRVTEINSPGGYLRALTTKAEDGAFSPGPMVMALLNGGAGKAA